MVSLAPTLHSIYWTTASLLFHHEVTESQISSMLSLDCSSDSSLFHGRYVVIMVSMHPEASMQHPIDFIWFTENLSSSKTEQAGLFINPFDIWHWAKSWWLDGEKTPLAVNMSTPNWPQSSFEISKTSKQLRCSKEADFSPSSALLSGEKGLLPNITY